MLLDNDLNSSTVIILRALSEISTLKVLDLHSIQLNEDASDYLSSVICNNAGLNELHLDNNDIGIGMLPIIEALHKLESLQV